METVRDAYQLIPLPGVGKKKVALALDALASPKVTAARKSSRCPPRLRLSQILLSSVTEL
jgi:hypothetical protein